MNDQYDTTVRDLAEQIRRARDWDEALRLAKQMRQHAQEQADEARQERRSLVAAFERETADAS